MGRFSKSHAHGFSLKRMGPDHWRMFWTVDFYYPTSRLRHPRGFSRDTNDAGALRFAKMHGLAAPNHA
jgi:hypothetical protein